MIFTGRYIRGRETEMYVAEKSSVYYTNPNETGSWELFLTVHPTKDCTKTTEEQALTIAHLLNNVLK